MNSAVSDNIVKGPLSNALFFLDLDGDNQLVHEKIAFKKNQYIKYNWLRNRDDVMIYISGKRKRQKINIKAKYYICCNYFLFSKIPEARTTPIDTKIMPKNFENVIFSFKKTNPPMRAKTGVKAPKAAV